MPSKRVLDRRVEASERQDAYGKLTTKQKHKRAVQRGHKYSREALRLKAQLDAEKV